MQHLLQKRFFCFGQKVNFGNSNLLKMETTTIELDEVLLAEADLSLLRKLVVHNDEVNTFDWVIETLIKVCGHTFEQAEQCSLFIHYKGKYGVKTGLFDALQPMKDAIAERGINVTIE